VEFLEDKEREDYPWWCRLLVIVIDEEEGG
jgi:hypothetical protein